jgi:hypothetical protein
MYYLHFRPTTILLRFQQVPEQPIIFLATSRCFGGKKLSMSNKQKFGNRRIGKILAALCCAIGLLGNPNPALAANLSETSAPGIISQLATAASSSPQISIVSPRPDEVLPSGDVPVNLQVNGISIFKNAALGLGPHLHLLLDGTPRNSVYDLSQPIVLNDLAPGTHTLEILANKPWHESWKNPGALAQVTFHVLAKSAEAPNPLTPHLVFVPPENFGAEPFLLDFYLTNPPSHQDPQRPQRVISDWQVRATINNQSFPIDRWQPFYLKGLNPGVNLVKLEYLDANSQVLDSSIRILTYQPNGSDSFARLLRNELPLANAIALFDPNSRAVAIQPPAPVVAPSPIAVPTIPVVAPSPIVAPAVPSPVAVLPPPVVVPSSIVVAPSPVAVPSLIVVPSIPVVVPTVAVAPAPSPIVVVPSPVPSPTVVPPVPIAIPSPVAVAPVVTPRPIAIPPAPTPSEPKPVPSVPNSVALLPSPVAVAPLPAAKISPAAPQPIGQIRTLAPAAGEDVVEFKVILRELWHTTTVRMKQFTNQVPPLVSKWSQDLSHWVSDRMQAMGQPTEEKAIEDVINQ